MTNRDEAFTEGTEPTSGYWEDQMAERLKREPSLGKRAIILAGALEECAEIYRQGPFPVSVYPVDEAKMDAVRKVAQLARTVAKELRALALARGEGER